MTRALIFAGAGASKAVSPERFPTTIEFFNQLPAEIKKNRLFVLVQDYLRKTDVKRIIDIEEVLWELQTLNRFAAEALLGDGIIGHSLSAGRLAGVTSTSGYNFGHLDKVLHLTLTQGTALVEDINATVYDFYQHEPDHTELLDNWLYLIRSMRSAQWDADIFTTNYDLVIEAAADFDGNLNYDRFLGLEGRIKKRLNLGRWTQAAQDDVLLTKLHGSVDWQFGGEHIYVGAPVYSGDHKKQAIIYPGFKGESDSTFFRIMHEYLANRLEETDVAVFIGFAFRDEYINRLIAERMNPRARVVVINPDKRVRFPVARHKPLYVRGGFDQSSVDEAISA